MNSQDLNKLVSGTSCFLLDDKELFYRPPPIEVRQRADAFYARLIDTYKYSGIPSKEKIYKFYVRRGLLMPNYEEEVEKSYETIQNLKKALFSAGPRKELATKIRKDLSREREGLRRLLAFMGEIDKNSFEGIAEAAKRSFLFVHSFYYSDGSLIFDKENPDSRLYNLLMYRVGQQLLDESKIKEVGRSREWRSIWSTKKEDSFLNGIHNLIPEQHILMSYSHVLDFAYESEKCPDDKTIADDDVFDGWYLVQIDKIKERRKKTAKQSSDKKFDMEEVFIMAQNEDHAKNIYNLNSNVGRDILKQRAKLIQEKGAIKDIEFPDIQHDLSLKANQRSRDIIKGKA